MHIRRVCCHDKQISVESGIASSERIVVIRPKWIGCPRSGFAQMLEFMNGCQLILIGFHVLRLTPGFRPMDLIIPGWLIRIRPALHVVHNIPVLAIIGGFFFGVAGGIGSLSSSLPLGGA